MKDEKSILNCINFETMSQGRYSSRKGFRLSQSSVDNEEIHFSPTPPKRVLSQRGYYSDIVMKDDLNDGAFIKVYIIF